MGVKDGLLAPRDGWKVMPLGKLVTDKLQYGINAPAVEFSEELPKYIRITDITEDGRYSESNMVSVNDKNSDSYWVKENDILLARTGASVGKSYLYDGKDGEMVYAGFLIKASIDTRKANAYFIATQLHTVRYWNWVARTSMRSGQPGINGKEYASYELLVPKLDVQNEISSILKDFDNVILNLEKLIAKKRDIKQGVMQELLTGKCRLPGFIDDWKPYSVGNLGSSYSGLTSKKREDFGHGDAKYIPFMNVLYNVAVDIKDFDAVDVRACEHQNAVKKGDLFFNTSSETPEEVGMCCVLLDEVENTYLNSFCFGFRLKDGTHNALFISYLMNSNVGREIMKELAQGSTRYNLSKNAFMKASIKLPIRKEQDAIVSILRDLDEEIKLVEKKLSKYRDLKQGMMQKLLSGEIRLA